MLKVIFFICLSLVAGNISAQFLKISVHEIKSKKTITNCEIFFLKSGNKKYVNKNGECFFGSIDGDSILTKAKGYEDRTAIISLNNDTIYLSPSANKNDTIKVTSNKKVKSFTLGNAKDFLKKKLNCENSFAVNTNCSTWGPSGDVEFIEEIDSLNKDFTYKIETLYYSLKPLKNYSPVYITIYLENPNDTLPGLLKYQELILNVNKRVKKGKLKIDLKSKNLTISNSSRFFIGISWYKSDETVNKGISLLLFKEGYNNTSFTRDKERNEFFYPFCKKFQNFDGSFNCVRTMFAVTMKPYFKE